MLSLLGPYKYVLDFLVVAALVAAAAVGLHAYNAHQQGLGEARVQAQWDKQKAADADAAAKAIQDARSKSDNLQKTIDSTRSQANAQITALNNTLAAAVAGLRERPARDSSGGVPHDPSTGAALGGTGATLLRQDAEFLARESARADALRLQLVECQAAYSAVRKSINGDK